MNGVALWIAQGFSIGRIPWMPGTFGSVLGLLWTGALLLPHRGWVYLLGLLAGLFCSVWACGKAERILGQTDPGSVVMDEIAAMPLCYAGWLFFIAHRDGGLGGPISLFTNGAWPWTVGIFLAFRFFDIVKPWPVRQSQRLPGGWGVTVDDVLAAVYVNAVVAAVWYLGAG